MAVSVIRGKLHEVWMSLRHLSAGTDRQFILSPVSHDSYIRVTYAHQAKDTITPLIVWRRDA